MALLIGSVAFAQSTNANLPTLFLVGDSTVKNGSGNGENKQWGWGEPLVAFFDSTKITVLNRARGGRSSRTYQTEGLWEQVLAAMKPGDFVLIQFGHNDGGALNDDSRARGSIKGIGEETQEIDNLLTKKHEVVHSFGWYLRKYVADARAKGATPILCSPVPRKIWKDGKITRDQYGRWAEAVAASEKVAFIDLNDIIARQYEAMGPEKVEPLFADEHTHTSLAGAELNAAGVIAGLKMLTPNRLASYFADKAASLNRVNSRFMKFDFGSGALKPEYARILPTTIYSADSGYGLEPGTGINGSQPFFFSVALPEGNYKVTVTFGDAKAAGSTTVKAELRRLMLEKVDTAPGKSTTQSFIVNVRTPQLPLGGTVHLKDRERTSEWWAWDEKLTLEFNGAHPAVSKIEIAKADVPTVFLLGDSTVCDQPSEPYNSWGQMLTRFFKPEIAIANHAESGEALKSSFNARRLDKVLGLIKSGDYLFLQFGHNDMKEKGEGIGAFTSYKTDLKLFVTEARKLGATPVLVTSMHRRTFDAAGKITNSLGDYPEAVRQLAKEEDVALIDLHAMSKTLYEALGPEKSGALFKEGDGTHHSNYGSYELARCIVEGIKANKLGLAKFLVTTVSSFNPAKPDPFEMFNVPASPRSTTVKPLGN
ncbi:MAG TPA: rhamnogalacturonan acetylesterase [Blastocatellia bacterium]|nr:rhamnogalacturonan acetylesterase [Blastocatellia bacterium]